MIKVVEFDPKHLEMFKLKPCYEYEVLDSVKGRR